MKITILDKSQIKYNGHYLIEHQTYDDIDDQTARQLIDSREAKLAPEEVQGVSFTTAPEAPRTAKFDVKANGGYVAEAVIDPAKRAKLEAEGKLNDTTPVVGEDNTNPKDETPEPKEKTEVLGADGKPLSDEEISKQQQQAAASVTPAGDSGEPDQPSTVGDLQENGQVVNP